MNAVTTTDNRMNEAAAAFGAIPLTGGTGAEAAPLALYSFATTNGLPTLIGGQWIEADGGTLTIAKDKYDAPGQSYDGREKSVKLVVVHNDTNANYRISAGALQAAFKEAGREVSFEALEMAQALAESNGYTRATVMLA